MNYLSLPGVNSNYASAPHTAAMDITGDIDLRIFLAADTWKFSNGQVVLSLWNTGTTAAYQLFISNTGVFTLFFCDSTPTVRQANCTVNLTTFNTGVPIWLRATLKVDNGAAGRDITFYSSSDGQAWVQLGTTVTQAGTITLNTCADNLTVGIQHATTQPFAGKVFYAELRSGINGTIVANPDFRGYVSSGFSDSAGNVWTVNATGVTPAQIMNRTPTNYLFLPGVSANYASTTDKAALRITGDLDLRSFLTMDKWGSGAGPTMIAKSGAGGQRSYQYWANAGGTITLQLSADGTAVTAATSSVGVPFASGTAGWVRATWVQSTQIVQFFTSTNGVTWIQLGTDKSIAIASIFAGTDILAVGANSQSGNSPIAGKFFYAEVRNGINGTVVASPDFRGNVASGFSDAQGNIWSINTSGSPAAALVSRTTI